MNILIADDDSISRFILSRVLKENGYHVTETMDGKEALVALQQPDSPRMVILDWMMPGMDGLEVIERIRSLPSDLPPYIIMLTSKGEKADVIAGLAAGANDYLAKPFDIGELFARLQVGRRMIEMQDVLISKADELRRTQADLQVLTAHLQTVREEERNHLARELHDSFGPRLTSLKMDLLWLDRQLRSTEPPNLAECGDRVVAMVPLIECITERTQSICASLRPHVLFELGLAAAIEWQTDDFAKHTGLICTLSLPADEFEVNERIAVALFRIVQESLSNVACHARATRVDVSLHFVDGHLELEICDNGRGFSPNATTGVKALGLLGIRERVGSFGGSVEFSNHPGMGALVKVTVPMPCDNPANTN
jgi:signal transduction histidine kinase